MARFRISTRPRLPASTEVGARPLCHARHCRAVAAARGFSLTELVVTMAVGAILIAVGVPTYNTSHNPRAFRAKSTPCLATFNTHVSRRSRRGRP